MAPFQEKLQSLLVKDPKIVEVAPKKNALMQGFEERLVEAFELGFNYAYSGITSAVFCFPEMPFVDINHQATLDFILAQSLDQLLQ